MYAKNVKFTHRKTKTLDTLDTFRIVCLQFCLCSTNVYCDSFYI